MPDNTTLMITLPADEALAAQLEQRLARHAEVMRPPPQALNLEMIALLVSIVASLTTIAANRAGIAHTKAETLKTLLEIKQMLAEQGRAAEVRIGVPTGPTRSLADADEAFLKQLLGVDA